MYSNIGIVAVEKLPDLKGQLWFLILLDIHTIFTRPVYKYEVIKPQRSSLQIQRVTDLVLRSLPSRVSILSAEAPPASLRYFAQPYPLFFGYT